MRIRYDVRSGELQNEALSRLVYELGVRKGSRFETSPGLESAVRELAGASEVEILAALSLTRTERSSWNAPVRDWTPLIERIVSEHEKEGVFWSPVLDRLALESETILWGTRYGNVESQAQKLGARIDALVLEGARQLELGFEEWVILRRLFACDRVINLIQTQAKLDVKTFEGVWDLIKNDAQQVALLLENPMLDVAQLLRFFSMWLGMFAENNYETDKIKVAAQGFLDALSRAGVSIESRQVLDLVVQDDFLEPLSYGKKAKHGRSFLTQSWRHIIASSEITSGELLQLAKKLGSEAWATIFGMERMASYREELWKSQPGHGVASAMVDIPTIPSEWLSRLVESHTLSRTLERNSREAPVAAKLVLHPNCTEALARHIALEFAQPDVRVALVRRGWEGLDESVAAAIRSSSSIELLEGIVEHGRDGTLVDQAMWKLANRNMDVAVRALKARTWFEGVTVSANVFARMMKLAGSMEQRSVIMGAMPKFGVKPLKEVNPRARRTPRIG